MTDKITKALETVNDLHGDTLKKLDDDALIEAMAQAMSESGNKDWMYADDWFKDIYIGQAIAALAVCRPIIEAPLRAENEKLRAATTPICVGRRIIGILAKEGAWTSENGASVIAADELFQRDPYEEIEKLRAALKPFADIAGYYDVEPDDQPAWDNDFQPTVGELRSAAAALKETGDE